jgi:hypothetical protein
MSRKATTADGKKATATTDEVVDENTHKKLREDKRDDKFNDGIMYGKKAAKRTIRDTMNERDARGAILHNLGGGPRVIMEWDMNQQSIAHQVFKLQIGKEIAYLSAVEIQKFLRWV